MKYKPLFILLFLAIPFTCLLGAAARASDGHVMFLMLLGILGIILGIMYLADYIRYLVNKYFSHHNHKDEVHA